MKPFRRSQRVAEFARIQLPVLGARNSHEFRYRGLGLQRIRTPPL